MTYALNGLIQAADYNSFVTTINAGWGTGTSDSGYGQPSFTSVAAGDPIRARPATVVAGNPPSWSTTPEWRTLINSINTMSQHQVGTTPIVVGDFAVAGSLPVAAAAASGIIDHATTVSTALSSVTAFPQRLNAVAQGSTNTVTSVTNPSTWSDYAQIVWTINFGSFDKARHFFNAGGQLGLQMSHPAGGTFNINQLISDICSDAGTMWFSSTNSGSITLAGISYNGVTKSGGANPAGETINPNNGFYSLTAGGPENTLMTQLSDFAYHGYTTGSFLRYFASVSVGGVVSLRAIIDEIPNGAIVSAGTGSALLVRYPSTTYLAQSWDNPVATNFTWTVV